ncbi:hypothetical protein ACFY98_38415, partial [Streptomyces tricolor]
MPPARDGPPRLRRRRPRAGRGRARPGDRDRHPQLPARPRPAHPAPLGLHPNHRDHGSPLLAMQPAAHLPGAPGTTKHIFVTGGVASSLGKGLTASSLGMLLKARGL